MREELQKTCELFIENRKIIREIKSWTKSYMLQVGSMYYTAVGLPADAEKLQAAEALLKDETSIFSSFRNNMKIPLLCRMAMDADPEEYFKNVKTVSRALGMNNFTRSDFQVAAAMTIVEKAGAEKPDAYLDRTREFYTRMKEDHAFLTGKEDMPYAAIFAITDRPVDAVMTEAEACFDEAKNYFKHGNSCQTLAHVLAMDPASPADKCRRTSEIWQGLKAADHKFGRGMEVAILGSLALLPAETDVLVQEVGEVDNWLKKQNGFGTLTMGPLMRRMYAAELVLSSYRASSETDQNVMLASALIALIQMQLFIALSVNITVMTATAAN